MKRRSVRAGGRWMWRFRVAPLLIPGLLLAWPVLAPSAPATDSPLSAASEDLLGRSTPYGTVSGFLQAVKDMNYARAAEYLDTERQGSEAEELARQLQTVLDRGLLMDIDQLSRKPEGELQSGLPPARYRVGTVDTRGGTLQILLDRMDRPGERPVWRFSPETLGRVPAAAEELGAFSPEAYIPRFLVDTTILSIPLYRLISILIGLAVVLGLGTLLTWALVPILRPLFRRLTGEVDDRTLGSIRTPIRMILIAAGIRLISMISVTLEMRQFWTRVSITVGILGLAWLVFRLHDAVSELGIRSLYRRGKLGKIAMWTLYRRLIRFLVVAVTALLLLHRAGADLTAILAGLGIGGIAIALAAQKTLENLFGGVMVITDEPLRVGDFCKVGDLLGTVEDVGLRSTRIRTLSRTVVAVPNGQISVMNIENYTLRDKFWLSHRIGVRYETTADQLRYLLAGIRALLYAHPMVEREGARVRFVGFGGSSLDLEIFAYVKVTAMPEFLGIQEDLLLRIMDLVAEAGTSVAFPSQTTYLARNTPLDAQKTEEAVARVRQWRERGELPFPDFRPDQELPLHDRIEYPPPGSSLRGGPGGG